jgi:hypothetical protein
MNDASHSRPHGHAPFPPTNWKLVSLAAAADSDSTEASRPLNEVLELYLPALIGFLQGRFHFDRMQAEDILHEFVLDKIIRQNLLEKARQERGRFRIFLLTALGNFTRSQLRKDSAQKRAPLASAIPLEEVSEQHIQEPSDQDLFDCKFAQWAFDETLHRMKRECANSRHANTWAVFDGRILQPLLLDGEPAPYSDFVSKSGFDSEIQAANALTTAKRIFARLFHQVVAETAFTSTDVAETIRELKETLVRSINK